jgi:hypothetical protein
MKIASIHIYSHDGRRRDLPLNPDGLNIITGLASTGKSSLSDIVEYCMGEDDCKIAEGFIREKVSWFAVTFQFPREQVFVAKPNPKPGKAQCSLAMVMRGREIRTPDFNALKHNGGDELVHEVLSSLLGIPEAKTPVPERSSRTGYSVNVKHTAFYLFQKQGLVASKELLFYRQAEEHLPQVIRDTFAVLFRISNVGDMETEANRRAMQRELKIVQRELRVAQETEDALDTRGLGLLAEARAVGIPFNNSAGNNAPSENGAESDLVASLRDVLNWQLPEEKFRSIESVQLTGGSPAGMPNDQDIKAVSQAVRNVIADYPARKAAALSLALHVKRLFTWERCASTLVAPLKWPLATSGDWWQRQRAADAASGSSEGVKNAEIVLEALAACGTGQIQSNWALVCSALNLLSDRGAKVKLSERQTLREDLLVIGGAIATALDKGSTQGCLPIVDTVFLDLCWRYLAAASRVATSFREFAALLPNGMRGAIFGDGFLRREMLFYVSRFALEFDGRSDEQATLLLAPLIKGLAGDRPLLVRLARLSTVFPSLVRLMPMDGNDIFDAEKARCERASIRPFDLSQLLEESPDLAPTALALSSLKPDLARQSIDQPIGFFKRLSPTYAVIGSWRGDKRLAAAMLTVALSSRNVLAVLESMAGDEEEAIRWAALDVAFSPILRARLEAMEEDASGVKALRTNLGRIVDTAVTTGDAHPWLAREFLSHYLDEYATPTVATVQVARFTLADFPRSRLLLGPIVGQSDSFLVRPMHPEVKGIQSRAGEVFKRVLLVLPPISVDPARGRAASKTSTPPLGLGLLATHLSQQGHDVHLVDCHRFPYLTEEVTRLAKTFDLIGFTTVFSTVRATQRLLKDIRGATQRPMLVVGGPAANLDGWRYSALDQEDLGHWDFAVSDDAISNLHRLVDALKTTDPWPVSDGIVANVHSTLVARRDVDSAAQVSAVKSVTNEDLGWMKVQLDRRLYTGPEGQYEPGRTRDLKGRVHEAHIVMSKGCDWNCSFCTERRELSGGERRRDVESVLQEVRQLAMKHANLRIQFIDDNLFPQIASPHNTGDIKREAGKTWAVQFLSGLKQIRDDVDGNLSQVF